MYCSSLKIKFSTLLAETVKYFGMLCQTMVSSTLAIGLLLLILLYIGVLLPVYRLIKSNSPHDQEVPPKQKSDSAMHIRPNDPTDPLGYVVNTSDESGGKPGRCRTCGSDNDPFFTYCQQCVSRL